MKFNFKDLFKSPARAVHRLLKRTKEAVTGAASGPHLCYQCLASRYARIRYAAEAKAAASRRRASDNALQAVRRNTRGLPPGFSWRGLLARACDLRRLPQVLRFDKLKKAWLRETHLFAQQGASLREALQVGRESRRHRLSKLARRVMGRRRQSASAMRWVVSVLERREFLGRGTEQLAIKTPVAYRTHTPFVPVKVRVFEECFAKATEQNPMYSRRLRRRIARKAANVVYGNMRGLQPIH